MDEKQPKFKVGDTVYFTNGEFGEMKCRVESVATGYQGETAFIPYNKPIYKIIWPPTGGRERQRGAVERRAEGRDGAHHVRGMIEHIATKPTRPVLRYHGGKWLLAPWILSHFPPHRVYVEPFCGAASVLLQKAPAHSELINDIDGDVVNLFRVLRDPEQSTALLRALALTPYAREEYVAALGPAEDPVERARRFVIVNAMRFTARDAHSDLSTAFRAKNHSQNKPSQLVWAGYPDELQRAVVRLRRVIIEHRPAVEVIETHDGPDTLIYCDPPYVKATRHSGGSTRAYRYELDDDGHRELAAALHRACGMVVVSGYPCELYDEDLFADWHRVTCATLADGAGPRTEALWLNDAAWRSQARQASLLTA